MKKNNLILAVIFLFSLIIYPRELVRISRQDFDSANKLFKELDFAGLYRDSFADVIVDESQLAVLNSNLIKYEIINTFDNKASYPTLTQINDSIDKLHSLYPLVTDIETLGITANGNPVKALKINGVNPKTDEVNNEFLLVANHHAREWQTVTVSLFFADSLLRSYSSDPLIKQLVDSTFIYIIPVLNPDGYSYSRTTDKWWRKNRSYRGGFYGVDLNRNYPGCCDGIKSGDWGNIYNSSTSHYPTTAVYCGPYPNSEREIKFLQNIVKKIDFDVSVSLHSYSELVLWPYGSSSDTVLDNQLISSIGTKIAGKILKQSGTGYYTPQKSDALYPVTGDSDGWIYGFTKYIKGITTLPFTFEVDTGFSPPDTNLNKLHRRVFAGLLYSAFVCDSLEGKIKEVPLKPLVSFDSSNKITWNGENSENQSQCEIRRYEGEFQIADAENTESMYANYNFAVATTQAYSAPNSFMALDLAFSTSICEPKYSFLSQTEDTFACYVWYDLEDSFDMALFEVSEDGFQYSALDTLNGLFNESSSGWKTFSTALSDFTGKQIYIRARVMFDDGTFGPGFYIDDVFPVTGFAKDSLYATAGNETSYQLNSSDSSFLFSVQPIHIERGKVVRSDRNSFYWQTGIHEKNEMSNKRHPGNNIIVLSNITTEFIAINVENKLKGSLKVFVLNENGASVMTVELKEGSNRVDLSKLASGIYFIAIGDRHAKPEKILIVR